VTALAIAICIVCQLFLVAGQVLLKHAMVANHATWRRTAIRLLPGIACMTVWFFLWLGLLEKWDLSKVFPFEGLNPALLVVAAWLFLRERVTPATWVGIGLITAGIVLVSRS
jgi:uncharacterized membrane protein